MTPGERPAGVARKGGEEVEFPGAQVDGPAVMAEAASDEIEVETFRHGQVDSTANGGWRPSRDLPSGSRLGLEHRRILELDG